MTETGGDLRYDVTHIQAAAEWAASRLSVQPDLIWDDDAATAILVSLTPGDATVYDILIAAPTLPRWGESQVDRRSYLVTVLNDFGRSYMWDGQDMHWSYAAEKFTLHPGDQHTGSIIAEFMTRLSGLLA